MEISFIANQAVFWYDKLKGHKSSPALRDEDKDENEVLIANNKK